MSRTEMTGSKCSRLLAAMFGLAFMLFLPLVGCKSSSSDQDSQDSETDILDSGADGQDSNADIGDLDTGLEDTATDIHDTGKDTHPRAEEPCIRGVDSTCCINEFRALSCESGSWTVLHDLPDGCPCSNATFCGGLAPLCPGAPDNYSLPPDAQ